MKTFSNIVFLVLAMLAITLNHDLIAQDQSDQNRIIVGLAEGDITPDIPIRLGGYGARSKSETTSVIHRLEATAIVFGRDDENPAVFITLDLVGISDYMSKSIKAGINKSRNIPPSHIAISVSHTHGAPEVGNILNILAYRGESFSDSLLSVEQLEHIVQYNEQVIATVLQVVEEAFESREPSIVVWGQTQAGFAKNRRTEGGPVDTALPLMMITAPDGDIRSILVNYACHGTTLTGGVNEIHGDWMSEAKINIEKNHPGSIAMVAIGCGGDANPYPRTTIADMEAHGREIADRVERLLQAQLDTLTNVPVCKIQRVKLPYNEVPSIDTLIKWETTDTTVKGYYARLALERIVRGQSIPEYLSYPVQVWTFGDKMAMINLAGEVVVDYSIRLKEELGAEKLWINAYMNEVPCYISSERVIREGGYEAVLSMYYYDKPSPFSTVIEDKIVRAVHEILPPGFKKERPDMNQLRKVFPATDGSLYLRASYAQSTGPNIKYMPEWKAFGWFNTEDQVMWEVQIDNPGLYKVYLDWSVDDARSGKSFILESNSDSIEGIIQKTGSWFTYRTEMIGTLSLKEGLNQLIFRSGDRNETGAMLDLRKIILVPEE